MTHKIEPRQAGPQRYLGLMRRGSKVDFHYYQYQYRHPLPLSDNRALRSTAVSQEGQGRRPGRGMSALRRESYAGRAEGKARPVCRTKTLCVQGGVSSISTLRVRPDQPEPRANPNPHPNLNPLGGSRLAGAVTRFRHVFRWRFPKKTSGRPKGPIRLAICISLVSAPSCT